MFDYAEFNCVLLACPQVKNFNGKPQLIAKVGHGRPCHYCLFSYDVEVRLASNLGNTAILLACHRLNGAQTLLPNPTVVPGSLLPSIPSRLQH